MMIKKSLIVFVMIWNTLPCIAQSLTIQIPEHHFHIDEEKALILARIEDIELYNNLSENTDITLKFDGSDFYFETIPDNLGYTNAYLVNDSDEQFTLYFTELPIISITTNNEIIDEEKIAAQFTYCDAEQTLVSTVGIEFRGGFSQTYPKKTFDLEFWEDETGEDNKNVQFGNMRDDDDWVLDALYNEPLRLRSHVAHKLWLDMHQLYYQEEEPEAKSGANVTFVEIFVNGQYNGLYNLSEQVDRKQLKLKHFEGELEGELYKAISWGASTFTSLPSFNNASRSWGGHEMKYPKIEDQTDWQNLYNFSNFVINSDDEDFKGEIWDRFNYDNYLDYFIFLNLLRATDNTGKNIFIAKYKADEPYFYTPWDLDGCFGTIWDGTYDTYTDDILENGFHERVIDLNFDGYANTVSDKWLAFRANQLNYENLKTQIEEIYYFFKENKIYERESLVYPNYDFDESDFDYILNWIDDRLTYLDVYFDPISSVVENDKKDDIWVVYPNPATDQIFIENSDSLENKNYKIYSFTGELMLHGYVKDDFISIDRLRNGHYMLLLDGISKSFMVL